MFSYAFVILKNPVINITLHMIPNVCLLVSGEMKSMFVLGATEIAAFGNSVWLDLFNNEEIEVLEYLSDLRVSE